VPSDAARIALATSRGYPDPEPALAASRSARELDGTGHEADVAECARQDVSDSVPIVSGRLEGAVVVTAFAPAGG
jgi:phosphosulfolactate phosphohydrolase-like enzyme